MRLRRGRPTIGAPYLVSELLEGATLRGRAERRRRCRSRKAIDYAAQIAHGLAAAHAKGIVHRDLKPENLFVTRDGRVKILDFGIAKVEYGEPGREQCTDPVRRDPPRALIGTAGYMSPEQARGQHVDHRTDIFSFGAVLYEMLAGRRAFKRDSSVETLNAILTDEPPDLPAADGTAPALDRVVRHCLEKSPEQRFQSARDVAFALEGLTNHSGQTAAVAAAAKARPTRAVLAWPIAALFALTTVALWVVSLRQDRSVARPVRFEIPAPEGGALQGIFGVSSVISPDGQTLAMVVTTGEAPHLYLRGLDSVTFRLLAGTDGASSPFWSPDSQWIGFFADGKLKRIGVAGGAPQTICAVPGATATTPWMLGTWGTRNTIVFNASDGLSSLLKVQASPGRGTRCTHDSRGLLAVVPARRAKLPLLRAQTRSTERGPGWIARLLGDLRRDAGELQSRVCGTRVSPLRAGKHIDGAGVRPKNQTDRKRTNRSGRSTAVLSGPWSVGFLGVDKWHAGLPGRSHVVPPRLVSARRD